MAFLLGRCTLLFSCSVIQRPERVIRRQGLDVEHVERRASDTAFTQNLDERRLVNDG